jgi:hypothetical protein
MSYLRWLPLIALLLSGCNSYKIDRLEALPLPTEAELANSCCWQALQTLSVRYGEKQIRLNAALAQSSDGVALVLLDPLGRRLLSLDKRANNITEYRAPEFPESLPSKFLLSASLFVWLPVTSWQFNEGSDWAVEIQGKQRQLKFRDQLILSALYPTFDAANGSGIMTDSINAVNIVGKTVILKHHRQPITIAITTEQIQQL